MPDRPLPRIRRLSNDERNLLKYRHDFDASSVYPRAGEERLPGTIIWRRGKKLKTRYRGFRLSENGYAEPVNLSIVYHKNRRRWVVYIDETPTNDGYVRLSSAKASMMRSILERLAAEAL